MHRRLALMEETIITWRLLFTAEISAQEKRRKREKVFEHVVTGPMPLRGSKVTQAWEESGSAFLHNSGSTGGITQNP